MATVYLAHDLKHDRQVAIKVLREELSASLGKERFLREIKVAAALQHPHVLSRWPWPLAFCATWRMRSRRRTSSASCTAT